MIITLLLLSNLFYVSAQETKDLQRRIRDVDCIFEGKVLRTEGFWNADHNFIYTRNVIEVYKVFKGANVGKTLEIITRGGETEDKLLLISHNVELNAGQEGIFFAKYQTLDRENELFNVSEPLEIEKDTYSQIEKLVGEKYKIVAFTSRQKQINDLIIKQTGIAVYNSLTNTDVGYEFANPSVTGWGSGQSYLEFDIRVSADGYEYGGGEIYLDYSVSAFGSNIAGSGNIVVTKETAILSSDYNLTLSDSTASKLRILVSSVSLPTNLYTLGNTSEKLCHVKFPITNLISNANIVFDYFAMQGGTAYYDNGNFQDFDWVWVGDGGIGGAWQNMIAADILDFYPTTIPAGTFDILTIVGNDFGYLQGSVKFKNVDGVTSYITAPPVAILDWIGDTVSSTIDTIRVYVPTSTTSGNQIAGTGRIVVEKAGGLGNDTSTQFLNIPYAVRTVWRNQSQEMFKMALPDKQNGGYEIQLSSSFDLISPYVSTYLDSSILKWQCATGINWQRGSNSVLNTSPETTIDGANLIYYAPFGTDSLTVAQTFMLVYKQSTCFGTNSPYPEVAYYLEEFDIGFNSNKLFRYDPNIPMTVLDNDYYSTILHELGHAHQVAHCANISNVMQPYNFPYMVSTALKPDDIAGGLAAKAQSIGVITDPNIQCNFLNNMNWLIPSTTGVCNGVNSIDNATNDEIKLQVFPNPFEASITLKYELLQKTEVEISITDLQGKVLYIKSLGKQAEGEYETEIQLSAATGMYILCLKTEKGISYNKICKQ